MTQFKIRGNLQFTKSIKLPMSPSMKEFVSLLSNLAEPDLTHTILRFRQFDWKNEIRQQLNYYFSNEFNLIFIVEKIDFVNLIRDNAQTFNKNLSQNLIIHPSNLEVSLIIYNDFALSTNSTEIPAIEKAYQQRNAKVVLTTNRLIINQSRKDIVRYFNKLGHISYDIEYIILTKNSELF